jgi:hypothetical protein
MTQRMPTRQQVTVPAAAGTQIVTRPKPFHDFVLLDHAVDSGEGRKRLSDLARALGLVFPPNALQERIDAGITAELANADVDTAKAIKEACFAVIDLTGDTLLYAGKLDTVMADPASMGKLALMLGAYQLRFDLTVLAGAKGLGDAASVFDRAEKLWADIGVAPARTISQREDPQKIAFETNHPGQFLKHLIPIGDWWDVVLFGDPPPPPRTNRVPMVVGGYDFGRVHVRRVFDVNGGVKPLTFLDEKRSVDYLDKIHENFALVSSEKFMNRLRMMIGMSSNEASETIVRDISMVYANSPLWRGGLFKPNDGIGGFWLGEDYHQKDSSVTGGRIWHAPPFRNLPKQKPESKASALAVAMLPGRNRAASARSLATLFAAIMKDKVVDKQSCQEIPDPEAWILSRVG